MKASHYLKWDVGLRTKNRIQIAQLSTLSLAITNRQHFGSNFAQQAK